MRYKLIWNLPSKNVISLDFVRYKKNVVDELTKGFSKNVVLESSRGIELKSLRKSPLIGGNPTFVIEDHMKKVQWVETIHTAWLNNTIFQEFFFLISTVIVLLMWYYIGYFLEWA